MKDIKKLALGSVSDLYNKDSNITWRDDLNKIKMPEYKSVSDLLKSDYASNNLVRQLAELQKNAIIPSYKEHMANLQKQLRIGQLAQEQIARFNLQSIVSDSIRKQFENMPKLAGIGNEFRKHIDILQKQAQAFSTHDANKHIQMLRKQAEIAMPLRNQFEMLNKQAGLNNMQAMLNELRKNVTHKIDLNNEIKELLNQYTQAQKASFHQIMEQGLSTIAQAYIEGAIETSHTESDAQDKGLNKSSSTFIDSFKALPSPVQTFLLWILCQVFLGAITDYAKEKTLSQIYGMESYILSLNEDKPISKQKLTQENKDIQWEDLNNFRAITGDNVRLHVSPSLNSEVIECIGKNTIVAILDKKDRQWLFVQVKSGDEFITGWITRTYTKPLKA
ncbi:MULTISPECIES: SH3 domain-containing protein [unclassified Escherichia]|uniref:SH3 domain-containing protein n=1 Tax=unclassified Escherichia TaxID=2608889 RepID=UPI001F10C26C|nr:MULTISPECIES: SH3 domain-containing protein [unclassified Escherichia]